VIDASCRVLDERAMTSWVEPNPISSVSLAVELVALTHIGLDAQLRRAVGQFNLAPPLGADSQSVTSVRERDLRSPRIDNCSSSGRRTL
jgi:hypothetical protein